MSGDGGRFADKVALVTGGNAGIGRAITARLLAEGARVAVFDLDAGFESSSGVLSLHCDVTDSAAVAASLATVLDGFGQLDVLVNNVGGSVTRRAPFWKISESDWNRSLRVNLTSQWICTAACAPHLIARGSGKVVNIVSATALNGSPGLSPYASSKAGAIGLTRTMAHDFGPYNVNVNAVAPGITETPKPKVVMTEAERAELSDNILARQLLKRSCVPEDTAAAVAFLASDDAAQITGQVLLVDGGRFA